MSISLNERLANVVDRLLSGRTGSQIFVLFCVSSLVVSVLALARVFITASALPNSLLWALVALLDPTSFASEETTSSVLLGILASAVGLVMVAMLIGLVTASLERRIADLQKGRTRVVHSNHVLILCGKGFPRYKVSQILRELVIAAQARRGWEKKKNEKKEKKN